MNNRNLFSENQEREGEQPQVKVYMQELSGPEEKEKIEKMIQIGSSFEMPPKAIIQFYGEDLIAYKEDHPHSEPVNELLRILSAFMAAELEPNPSSWKACTHSFWEEFITACFPHLMRISPDNQSTKQFLNELKKFARWLDQQKGCSWYAHINRLIEENEAVLVQCEEVLNEFHQQAFPKLYQEDWSPLEDLERITQELQTCEAVVNSIFELKNVTDGITTIYDINSTITYQIMDFPSTKIKPGMLVDGTIGKSEYDFYWSWYFTENVYPNQAQKYIAFV